MRTYKALLIFTILLVFLNSGFAAPDFTDEELAERFAPHISLHEDQRYEPIDAEWYIERAELRNKEEDELVDPNPLPSELTSIYDSDQYYLDVPEQYTRDFHEGNYNPQNVVYYRVEDLNNNYVALQYFTFYPYSVWEPDSFSEFAADFVSRHNSDWEGGQLILSKDRKYYPVEASYAQHYKSESKHWTNMEKEGRHPIFYQSLNGQATFFESGLQEFRSHHAVDGCDIDLSTYTHLCTGDEWTGDAQVFEPEDYELKNIDETSWIDWEGYWEHLTRLDYFIDEVESSYPDPTGKTNHFGTNMWESPLEWHEESTPLEGRGDIVSSSEDQITTDPQNIDYNPPIHNGINEPEMVNPGEEAEFTTSYSNSGPSTTEVYWEIEDEENILTEDSELSYVFDEGGNYLVSSTVIDVDGASDQDSEFYQVNEYPTAQFSVLDEEVKTFEEITVEDDSFDDVRELEKWEWSFENQTLETRNPEILFEDSGIKEIELTVIDDMGLQNSTTERIRVLNRPPEAEFIYEPDEVYHDTLVEFESTSTDMDGEIVSHEWYIDGELTSEQEEFSNVFSDAVGGVSSYEVELVVTDDDGDTNSSRSVIEIANKDPEVSIILENETISVEEELEASADYSDEDGDITGVAWSIDDNTYSSDELVHEFSNPGTYHVEVIVEDEGGARARDSVEVTVDSESVTERFSNIITGLFFFF